MKRYQVTRFGTGWEGNKILRRRRALIRLRRRLTHTTHGPYKVRVKFPNGNLDEFEQLQLFEAMTRVKSALVNHPPGVRINVGSYNYDEPRWVIRSVEWNPPPPPEHPFITYGKTWVGHSSYLLGASGPPPHPCDCSGFTKTVIKTVSGVDVVHQADAQMRDTAHFLIFTDPTDLESGDLVFYHYPNTRGLRWDQATHVEFFDHPGTTLGSRPSTGGVSYYRLQSFDYDAILCYGRVKGG